VYNSNMAQSNTLVNLEESILINSERGMHPFAVVLMRV